MLIYHPDGFYIPYGISNVEDVFEKALDYYIGIGAIKERVDVRVPLLRILEADRRGDILNCHVILVDILPSFFSKPPVRKWCLRLEIIRFSRHRKLYFLGVPASLCCDINDVVNLEIASSVVSKCGYYISQQTACTIYIGRAMDIYLHLLYQNWFHKRVYVHRDELSDLFFRCSENGGSVPEVIEFYDFLGGAAREFLRAFKKQPGKRITAK